MENLLNRYRQTRSLSPRYLKNLSRTVEKLCRHGLSSVSDLTPQNVSTFLASLSSAEKPLSLTTVSNVRREVMTLWRFAYEEGATDVYPSRVRRVRPRPGPIEAWSLEQLSRILGDAYRDTTSIGGRHSQLGVCDVIPAWIFVGYETGMRFSDMLDLRCSEIRGSCVARIAMKTGKPLVRRLSEAACGEATKLAGQGDQETVFGWALTRRRASIVWRTFLDRHNHTGSSKFLRRTAATMIERRHPGEAAAFLQHSSPQVARRHYIDESLAQTHVSPPPISLASRSLSSCSQTEGSSLSIGR